jgi:hypothetical protein
MLSRSRSLPLTETTHAKKSGSFRRESSLPVSSMFTFGGIEAAA